MAIGNGGGTNLGGSGSPSAGNWAADWGTVAFGAGETHKLCEANSRRIYLGISQSGNGSAFLRPDQLASAGNGFNLRAQDMREWKWIESGPLCQHDWSGFSAAATTIFVCEVLAGQDVK